MTNKKTNILTAADIFGFDDSRIELVEVPEWGGSVYVRSLTGTERDSFEADMVSATGKGGTREANFENLRAKLVARTACDEDGKSLFSLKDLEKLGNKNAAALDRLYDVGARLSGLKEEDKEELLDNFPE